MLKKLSQKLNISLFSCTFVLKTKFYFCCFAVSVSYATLSQKAKRKCNFLNKCAIKVVEGTPAYWWRYLLADGASHQIMRKIKCDKDGAKKQIIFSKQMWNQSCWRNPSLRYLFVEGALHITQWCEKQSVCTVATMQPCNFCYYLMKPIVQYFKHLCRSVTIFLQYNFLSMVYLWLAQQWCQYNICFKLHPYFYLLADPTAES